MTLSLAVAASGHNRIARRRRQEYEPASRAAGLRPRPQSAPAIDPECPILDMTGATRTCMTVDHARIDEMRYRLGAAFDQYFFEALDGRAPLRSRPAPEPPADALTTSGSAPRGTGPSLPLTTKQRAPVGSEAARRRLKPAVRIDDDAGRLTPGDSSTVSIGSSAVIVPTPTTTASTCDSKPVQVIERARAVDPARSTAHRRDAPVERLPELRDDKGSIRTSADDRFKNTVVNQCQRAGRRSRL